MLNLNQIAEKIHFYENKKPDEDRLLSFRCLNGDGTIDESKSFTIELSTGVRIENKNMEMQ